MINLITRQNGKIVIGCIRKSGDCWGRDITKIACLFVRIGVTINNLEHIIVQEEHVKWKSILPCPLTWIKKYFISNFKKNRRGWRKNSLDTLEYVSKKKKFKKAIIIDKETNEEDGGSWSKSTKTRSIGCSLLNFLCLNCTFTTEKLRYDW